MPDRGMKIVPAQRQSPAEPGQGRVIVTVWNRSQQGFGMVDITPVESNLHA
jgi:hypothetical protein